MTADSSSSENPSTKIQQSVSNLCENLNQSTIENADDTVPLSKKALKKAQEKAEKEQRKAEMQAKLDQEKAAREAEDYSRNNYGELPICTSTTKSTKIWTNISSLNESCIGQKFLIRARLHNSRSAGKQTFIVLRQRYDTLQIVVAVNADTISKAMVKYASNIPKESIVDVTGVVCAATVPIESCSKSSIELLVDTIFVTGKVIDRLPLQIEDASRPEPAESTGNEETYADGFPRVLLDTRLNHRVIDLRTSANQAIFKIQAAVCELFREFLLQRYFTEIHSPKIIPAASEGGSNVFKVSYFKGEAYLAQSPQLYKQMAICADFGRVFEIAPVFRAENSFTHRHMTEFVGLDIEMAFNEHYHEVLDLLGEMFVFIFDGLKTRFAMEIETIRRQYPFEDFKYLPKTLVLKYAEGVEMLQQAGVSIGPFDDINTEQEKLLGKLIKQKYDTDFYILDKFPLVVRPFYTMPDPNYPGYANAYDFFMRGEEIISGAQRVHDYDMLVERAKHHGIDLATIDSYLDAFKYGAPPHAGCGVGLERIVMLYFGLGNIRRSSMFPRDPKRIFP